MPNDQTQSKGSSIPAEVDLQVIVEATQQPLIKSFPCLRIFLRKKIEGKGKQIEQRSKLGKEVVQLKLKGNQKQFELNAKLDACLVARAFTPKPLKSEHFRPQK